MADPFQDKLHTMKTLVSRIDELREEKRTSDKAWNEEIKKLQEQLVNLARQEDAQFQFEEFQTIGVRVHA